MLIMLWVSVPPMLTTMPLPLVSKLRRRLISTLPISLRSNLCQAQIILDDVGKNVPAQTDQHDVVSLDNDLGHVIMHDAINLDHDRLHVIKQDMINLASHRHHGIKQDAINLDQD